MATSNKTIAKNTAFLYVRMLVVMLINFYTARIILKALGAVDYGIYSVVGGVVALMAFLNNSLAGSTSRFLTYELGTGDIEKLKKTFAASLNLHIGVALLVFVLGETIGLWFFYEKLVIPENRMNAAFWVYQLSIITSMISITQVPYNSSLIAHENMSIYAYVGIYEAVSNLIISYLIMISPIDTLVFYSLLLATNGIGVQLFYRFYTRKNYSECHFMLITDKAPYKPIVSYTGWELFGGVAYLSQNQGITILLNVFFGPLIVTARTISVQIQNAVVSFSSNFLTAIKPRIVKSFSAGDFNEMYTLTFYSMKLSYAILFAVILPIIFETKYILDLWLGDTYPDITVLFVRLTLIHALVNIVNTSFIMCVHAVGRIKYTSLIGGSLIILSLPFSYVLLRLGCNPESVLYVLIISTIGLHLVGIFFVHRYVPFSIKNLLRAVYLPIFLITLVTLVGPYIIFVNMGDGFLRLISILIVTEIMLLPSVWFFALTRQNRADIFNYIRIHINCS